MMILRIFRLRGLSVQHLTVRRLNCESMSLFLYEAISDHHVNARTDKQ